MRAVLLALSCLSLLLGCQKPSGKWEALRKTPVYKEANEVDEIDFVLDKGEVCALGVERVVKVFMYRQVSCRKGEGWVLYDGGYPFKKMD